MPKRSYSAAGSYRYGFNGKENDNDVKGLGNQQDYGMRIYDARVGRFLSVDPISKQYPDLTTYQFASNRPIDGIDLDGLEWELKTAGENLKKNLPKIKTVTSSSTPPIVQQSVGLNLGTLKLRKQDYSETTWWMPSTKVGVFVNNSLASGWNQAVSAFETGSLFFSKEGREEVRHKTFVQILKFCSWLAETNDEEKFDQAKEIFTDVGTYEDFAGAFILGKFSSGILQNSRSTLWKTTILTRQERLQLFYQKLTESKAASNVDEAVKLINNTLDGVEDAFSGAKKQSGIPTYNDGRMYGILDDKFLTRNKDGSVTALTRGNRIEISKDGGFKVFDRKNGNLIFEKPAKK